MSLPFLTAENIEFSYKNQSILKNLSFHLKKGEIVSLVGMSGSGKSTLFKILTGLVLLQKGSIKIDGVSPPKCFHHIAYMMQEDLLLPWRSIIHNMTLAAELGPFPHDSKDLKIKALELLDEMGLLKVAEFLPDQLSGGMRQRVALARTLLQKKAILLLDEPFNSLDIALREQLYNYLRLINSKYQTTILMITHDFRDALSLSDRILLLKEGRIDHSWIISEETRGDPATSGILLNEIKMTMFESLPIKELF